MPPIATLSSCKPAADRQHRHAPLDGGVQHGELVVVVLRHDAEQRLRRRRLAVAPRVDVAATVQHDGVDALERSGQEVETVDDRRQDHRLGAGADERRAVALAAGVGLATDPLSARRDPPRDRDQGDVAGRHGTRHGVKSAQPAPVSRRARALVGLSDTQLHAALGTRRHATP